MSATAIALNRFGLGARPDETVPDRPQAWLLDQFARFDPRPAAIAALPSTGTIAEGLSEYLHMPRKTSAAEGSMTPTDAKTRRRRARRMAKASSTGVAMADGDAVAESADRQSIENNPGLEARRAAREQARNYYLGAVSARAETAIASPAPFAERLVHFWANHFAVSIDKLTIVGLAGQLEFDVIRPHLTGTFGDMLQAVERHPAMLLYLDQAASIGPNSQAGQFFAQRRAQRRSGINENLARETLELHTLGVRTGYSQQDVTELARALTGWTVAGLVRGSRAKMADAQGNPGSFVFAERLHEPGTRTILGRSFAQPGEDQATAILDSLATHPATARHIATKLARHFAGDEPPPPLVGRLEQSFLKTGGNLMALYHVLVESPECWTPQPVKFKSPWEWSIGAMRALGTHDPRPQATAGLLSQLGQPVWKPGSPAGWDDTSASWIGPDAVMRRVEAAERMAGRTGDRIDGRDLAARLFPASLSDTTAQAIRRAESPTQGLALMLVSPESMWR